jgi:hypothetical protein
LDLRPPCQHRIEWINGIGGSIPHRGSAQSQETACARGRATGYAVSTDAANGPARSGERFFDERRGILLKRERCLDCIARCCYDDMPWFWAQKVSGHATPCFSFLLLEPTRWRQGNAAQWTARIRPAEGIVEDIDPRIKVVSARGGRRIWVPGAQSFVWQANRTRHQDVDLQAPGMSMRRGQPRWPCRDWDPREEQLADQSQRDIDCMSLFGVICIE